jgi:hypothetical protein
MEVVVERVKDCLVSLAVQTARCHFWEGIEGNVSTGLRTKPSL